MDPHADDVTTPPGVEGTEEETLTPKEKLETELVPSMEDAKELARDVGHLHYLQLADHDAFELERRNKAETLMAQRTKLLEKVANAQDLSIEDQRLFAARIHNRPGIDTFLRPLSRMMQKERQIPENFLIPVPEPMGYTRFPVGEAEMLTETDIAVSKGITEARDYIPTIGHAFDREVGAEMSYIEGQGRVNRRSAEEIRERQEDALIYKGRIMNALFEGFTKAAFEHDDLEVTIQGLERLNQLDSPQALGKLTEKIERLAQNLDSSQDQAEGQRLRGLLKEAQERKRARG
jgi:hypothetical protein